MNKLRFSLVALCLAGATALGAQAVASAHGSGGDASRQAVMPPVLHEPVPTMPRDLGLGERLLVVTAGTFDTRAEAEAADAALSFGEIQGFYAVPTSQFEGLAAQLGSDKPWVLASVFRTQAGAEEFAELARVAGASQARVSATRVTSLGGSYAGLGQEEDPNGSGPLTSAIEASRPVAP